MTSKECIILITGGSRGLGRGIATQMAELGFSVAVNYAGNQGAAEETLQLCVKKNVSQSQRFEAFQADISVPGERAKLISEVLRKMGRIDALVNNAGIAPRVRADITTMTEGSYEEVLRVNLQGPLFLTQAVVNYWLNEKPQPRLPGGFKLIFNSSISATTASTNRGEYCISKAGVAMVAQLWAVRLASEGIQVFELRPGIMETDMTSAVKEKYDALLAEGLVPQRRWGQPEDVGRAVGAILQGAFPYSTGEVLYVDGGMHVRQL
ncbi:MAG: 3-ketoacyl-ACP reductase [Ignavibacteria bacterium]|nr:3-ketoacyl-ACP reductase [Ignavibacteria bacterium]